MTVNEALFWANAIHEGDIEPTHGDMDRLIQCLAANLARLRNAAQAFLDTENQDEYGELEAALRAALEGKG